MDPMMKKFIQKHREGEIKQAWDVVMIFEEERSRFKKERQLHVKLIAKTKEIKKLYKRYRDELEKLSDKRKVLKKEIGDLYEVHQEMRIRIKELEERQNELGEVSSFSEPPPMIRGIEKLGVVDSKGQSVDIPLPEKMYPKSAVKTLYDWIMNQRSSQKK